jgi:hypothetical protein
MIQLGFKLLRENGQEDLHHNKISLHFPFMSLFQKLNLREIKKFSSLILDQNMCESNLCQWEYFYFCYKKYIFN